MPVFTQESKNDNSEWPVLKGPYLGQKPPGMTPEIFAPGIISTERKEFAITISLDGRAYFFTRKLNVNTIVMSNEVNGKWSEPASANFSGKYFDFEPLFTPDNNRIKGE